MYNLIVNMFLIVLIVFEHLAFWDYFGNHFKLPLQPCYEAFLSRK